ncbi:unnamed protein product [Scytosiphon promiscuus]
MGDEDSADCSWVEERDADGNVYYVNNKTLASHLYECCSPIYRETAWEMPPSVRESTASIKTRVPGPSELIPYQDPSASWTEVFDDSTNSVYFFNTSTQESSWSLGEDERLASGIYCPSEEDGSALGNFYDNSHEGEQSSHFCGWKDQVLQDFEVPQVVSEAVGRAASAHAWPRTVDGRPSRLERWDVLKAADPYREHFATGEAWRQEHPEFEPKLCFYAFDAAVEHVERYWVEEAEAPFRCRLQKGELKFSRDIAKWEARAPAKRKARGGSSDIGPPKSGQELRGDDQLSSGSDDTTWVNTPSQTKSFQDWTSGPDRYQITQSAEPEWGWSRLFTFFAYAASKYHVLETTEPPLAQKARLRWHGSPSDAAQNAFLRIVKGNFLTPERGWKCVLAFFAFDNDVPGSNRYYVEEKDEPHLRTRIGMEASSRWGARHTFAAFDVPVPGSCALDVHYTIRSTDSLNPYPEQCRISLKDPWGAWEQKFRFYAFPAEHVLLSAEMEAEGSITQDALSVS